MTERPVDHDEISPGEDPTTTPDVEVPAATGSTTTYTTGTLEPGEIVPASSKPEGEGPTQGEGPIDQAIQAEDTEEFREARQNRDD